MLKASWALLKRDLGQSFKGGAGPLLSCGFYITLMAMIPLSLGPDPDTLRKIAPGLSFLCLALANLLSLERLFERDYEEGLFDLYRLGPLSLELITALKILAQWLGTGLSLSLLTPVVMALLGARPDLLGPGFIASVLGSLSFAAVGGIGAALALGARKGGMLIAMIVLPFYIPPVIFGAGLMDMGQNGQALGLLAAYSLLVTALSPLAMAAGLRVALN